MRSLASKTALGENNLKSDMQDQDILIIKESGKFEIKDLEEEMKGTSKNNLKRKRNEAFNKDEDMLSSDDDNDNKNNTGQIRDKLKNLR